VFEELPLDEFGNRLPPITAEVAWAGQDELPERTFDPIPLSESIFPNTLNTAGNGLVNFRLGYRVEFRNGNIQVGGFPGLRRFRLFDAVEDLQIAAEEVTVDGNSCTPMCCNADGDIYCALGSTSSTVVLISWETLREIRRGSGINVRAVQPASMSTGEPWAARGADARRCSSAVFPASPLRRSQR